MTGLDIFDKHCPELVVVYGDVNSTVAGALVPATMQSMIAHVEAGLRSLDLSMPEEINRLVTDRLSAQLFATAPDAVAHLGNEGVYPDKIYFVDNPMINTLLGNIESPPTVTWDTSSDLKGPRWFATPSDHRHASGSEASRGILSRKAGGGSLTRAPMPTAGRGSSIAPVAFVVDCVVQAETRWSRNW